MQIKSKIEKLFRLISDLGISSEQYPDYYEQNMQIAVEHKRKGEYLESLDSYLFMVQSCLVAYTGIMNGLFKTIACAGYLREAMQLLTLCDDVYCKENKGSLAYILSGNKSNFKVHMDKIKSVVNNPYALIDYLSEISGNNYYRLPRSYEVIVSEFFSNIDAISLKINNEENDNPNFKFLLNDAKDGYVFFFEGDKYKVKSLNIPAYYKGLPVKEIGKYALYYGVELEELTIPEGVEKIGEYAFANCGIHNLKLPNSLREIEDAGFMFCTKVKELYIPKNLKKIGDSAFNNMVGLERIVVDTENKVFDSRENCNAIINTKNNSLMIGCCNSIIPNSVVKLEEYAFLNCRKLTKIVIPSHITKLPKGIFRLCSSVESIEIGEGLKIIEESAFDECHSLKEIKVSPSNKHLDSRENCNCIIDTKKNELLLACKNSFIPKGILTLGEGSFKRVDITSLVIPNTVSRIKEWAFFEMNNLKDIYYDGSKNEWKKIKIESFNDKTLNQVEIHCKGLFSKGW